jgi:hypothetical protein
MATSKRCEICETRPVSPQIKRYTSFNYCEPCDTKAGMENAHSDHGHGDIDTYTLANTNFTKKSELEAYKAETKAEMETCWVCHPELDQSDESYVQRDGTSRAGMTIYAKGSAKEKAALIALAAEGTGNGSVKYRTVKGVTTLKGTANGVEIRMTWEGDRFVSGTFGPRKVRNVSEALRRISAK